MVNKIKFLWSLLLANKCSAEEYPWKIQNGWRKLYQYTSSTHKWIKTEAEQTTGENLAIEGEQWKEDVRAEGRE